MLASAIKAALVLQLLAAAVTPAADDPLAALKANQPSDFAVAVRDTRMFAGMEPYAKILGPVAAGEFYPALSVTTDQYGIVWAEVALEGGERGYLSDVVIVREREPALRELLKKAKLADIGMWDDEILRSVQESGVEIGFTSTQLLFAQGPPLLERVTGQPGPGEAAGRTMKEWFYPRLVVFIEDDTVVGYTAISRLAADRAIEYVLTPDDPDFSTSGRWQSVTESDGLVHMVAAGGSVGRFRVHLPVKGTWRLGALWAAAPDRSTRVIYEAKQRPAGGEENDEGKGPAATLARMTGNQRLHDRREVELGIFDAGAGAPLLIEISSEDGKPFSVAVLKLEYVNDPVLPAEAAGSAEEIATGGPGPPGEADGEEVQR
jgi:hypothetical protein